MGSPSAARWERAQLERAEAWRVYSSHGRKGLPVKGSSSRGRKETGQARTALRPLLFQVTMVRTPLGRRRRSQRKWAPLLVTSFQCKRHGSHGAKAKRVHQGAPDSSRTRES